MTPSFRRAKIVCTLGPASRSPEMIDRLVQTGMDVVRLNFSHGTREEKERTIATVREVCKRRQKPVAVVADLQGPKIRTGPLRDRRPVALRADQEFVITTEDVQGDERLVSTNYADLPEEVSRGDRVLLADGLIELRVEAISGREIHCRVVNGGDLGEKKGINLPGVKLRVPALTEKDREDLAFALTQGVNYVAISFVRRARDMEEAREAIRAAGADTPLIAKLEKPEAIDNLDAILAASDGVMVARGDLGVEMTPEKVPVIQKQIIARARDFRIPVITATQMLESMTKNPRPTRAEASDVANAVFDGTDALMLSAETATGKYPVESVGMMDRIICEAEASILDPMRPDRLGHLNVAEAISNAVCHAAEELQMKLIAVFTESGSTGRLISKYRPKVSIIAFSPNQQTRRRLSLFWGTTPRAIEAIRDIDHLTQLAERRLKEESLVTPGDIVGIVAGTPLGTPGTTNFMKIHVIGPD